MPRTARTQSTPGRKPLLGDQTADRLYEAALTCFLRNGFRATSMEDIAGEVGVARTTLYSYYRSKKDMVLEVLVRQNIELLADVGRRVEHLRGMDRIAETICLGIEASVANPYFLEFIRGGHGIAWVAEILGDQRFREVETSFWAPIIDQAVEVGELRADRAVSDIIGWITFQQFTIATHSAPMGLTPLDIRDHVRTYLAAALRPQPPQLRSTFACTPSNTCP